MVVDNEHAKPSCAPPKAERGWPLGQWGTTQVDGAQLALYREVVHNVGSTNPDGQTKSDAYDPTMQSAQVGS